MGRESFQEACLCGADGGPWGWFVDDDDGWNYDDYDDELREADFDWSGAEMGTVWRLALDGADCLCEWHDVSEAE